MLSVDGFRWDYPEMTQTPNLDKIAKQGVKAQSLKPSFPTKTFPNHYSMATGLHPDHHGIVNNSFYDPAMDKYYAIRMADARDNPAFYEGEPIWVTAEKQGITSASYFWVGSEVLIDSIRPTYWKRYQHDFPFAQRIDSVIAWLQKPAEKRPHLITWYMHEPDAIGHRHGPAGNATLDMVTHLDSLIGVFMHKLDQLPKSDKVDVIITSDHGMGAISPQRLVKLQNHVNKDWLDEIQGGNPMYLLEAKEGYTDSVYLELKKVDHIKVWKHGEVPDHLNYGTHRRTLDLIVVADSAWSVNFGEAYDYTGGTHGYENTNKDMHAIFYAYGPDFRKKHIHPTFENVDLYPLITHLLDLKPAQVDGKLERVEGMLVNDD
ncbi:MAG: ectonucleotide pyrophosphatase/phosphodiesterase [Bacteroidales bacterium]|nr:ectonucleotide pyrophosphatase/phosphodiesterase [Bacteroidales bacterium]